MWDHQYKSMVWEWSGGKGIGVLLGGYNVDHIYLGRWI